MTAPRFLICLVPVYVQYHYFLQSAVCAVRLLIKIKKRIYYYYYIFVQPVYSMSAWGERRDCMVMTIFRV